jgi:hypothetical protein
MSEEKEKKEDWMQTKWRPAMGWMYMIICTLDMGIFPILWSLLQVTTSQPVTQWSPLTLQGAGLFHLAMGAVLGIAAFGRTQEKIAGTAANIAQPVPPTYAPAPVDYNQYQPQQQSQTIVTGFGGKPAPAPMSQPLL